MTDDLSNSDQEASLPTGPQPNFDAISEYAQGLVEQLQRFSNIPGIHGLQALANTITAHMDDKFSQLDDKFSQLDNKFSQRFDAIDTRLNAINQNGLPRVQNSHLNSPDDALTPLTNSTTNNKIPNFPRMPTDIDSLRGQELNQLLTALGASLVGDVAQQQQNLRTAIGLTPIRQSVFKA
ncbi:hypothetical protein EV356DRAFT_579423 [Viridothelium virens]|uniref:Uncharacterized protein n=1 Tax=Viridothelium virens TaxID=1048519 RepID=A0A6A6H0T0_VIRVR|nr:hypothetical protein EV356DRAFT_579423 [Viridothelium virens]